MDFQISALDERPFLPLFDLPDAQLAGRLAARCTARSHPGYPCRVSLVDARIGETLLLLNFTHQAAASPFRASHAIYVRAGARRAQPAPNEVPDMFRSRTLSLRAFDGAGALVGAELCEGKGLEAPLRRLLAHADVDQVHIHFAAYGCFGARAVAAGHPLRS
jgi:hypothetical protein